LKKRYGVGYQLTIEKSDDKHEASKGTEPAALRITGMQSNDENLKQIVTGAVSEASLLNNVGAEMSYQLPMGATSKFTSMLDGLDKEADEGRISSYGVSVTTLDEVFLLVARGEDSADKTAFSSSMKLGVATNDSAQTNTARSRMDLENEGLFVRHIGALFRKRAASFRRDKKAWVCTTILPSLFVFIGFIILKLSSPDRNLTPVLLSLNDFNAQSETMLPRNPIVFNSPEITYPCQPGKCAYQGVQVVNSSITNEEYYFCGYQARLPAMEQCTIEVSSDIISRITDAGAFPEPANVSSVLEVCENAVSVHLMQGSPAHFFILSVSFSHQQV
jgi:hypothetical protein